MIALKQGNTNIVLHTDNETMITTRLVNNRLHKVITSCNGTTGDFAYKITTVSELDDTMYIQFSDLQKEGRDGA